MTYKIEYTKYGIANRFNGERIEIHQKLREKRFRPLLLEILEHEKQHTDTGYSLTDLKLDLNGFKNKKLYRQFILTTPSSWVQFSPMYKSHGKWYFDITLILFWICTLGIIGIILWNYGS